MNTNEALKVSPINSPEKLGEHVNLVMLCEAVKKCFARIDALEEQIKNLSVPKTTKSKKDPTRISDYSPYIREILADGKIRSFYSVHEEFNLRHPELPAATLTGIQTAMGRMAKLGQIDKVNYGNYRKKA